MTDRISPIIAVMLLVSVAVAAVGAYFVCKEGKRARKKYQKEIYSQDQAEQEKQYSKKSTT